MACSALSSSVQVRVVDGWSVRRARFITYVVCVRAVEECNNGLVLLNGQPCMGGIMRVGRPKSYPGDSMSVPMLPGASSYSCASLVSRHNSHTLVRQVSRGQRVGLVVGWRQEAC
jgi:hypothetical protein